MLKESVINLIRAQAVGNRSHLIKFSSPSSIPFFSHFSLLGFIVSIFVTLFWITPMAHSKDKSIGNQTLSSPPTPYDPTILRTQFSSESLTQIPMNPSKVELINSTGQATDIVYRGEFGTYSSIQRSIFDFSSKSGIQEFHANIRNLLKMWEQGQLSKGTSNSPIAAPPIEIGGDIKIALETLLQLSQDYADLAFQSNPSENDGKTQHILFNHIQEIANAINNNYTAPIISKIALDRNIMRGWMSHINRPGESPGKKAINIPDSNSDSSLIDPVDSPLWKSKNISGQDTYLGFERPNMLRIDPSKPVKYSKPKTGYGTRPGIRVIADFMDSKGKMVNNGELKVRIDVEAHTGPFLARLGNALGFSTYVVDYVPKMNIKVYTQEELKKKFEKKVQKKSSYIGINLENIRFFTEYHSRKSFGAEIELPDGGISKDNRQRVWNPFKVVLGAKLKTGKLIDGVQFKSRLYTSENVQPEELAKISNYNLDFINNEVEYFTIGPVSVEHLREEEVSVGSWGWNVLNHDDLRESRGFTLLAAWLSMHDVRRDNTRLMLINEGSSQKLELRISDWGSGLGTARGHLIGFENERPNEMLENILQVERDADNNVSRVLITGFKPNQISFAADKMNYDDARWMARKIAQLSVNQIQNALTAAGYPEAEKWMYTYKLIARRNNFIRELGLEKEVQHIEFKKPVSMSFPDGYSIDDKGVLIYPPAVLGAADKTKNVVHLKEIFESLPSEYKAKILASIFIATPVDQIQEINFILSILSRVQGINFNEQYVQIMGLFEKVDDSIGKAKFHRLLKTQPGNFLKILEEVKAQQK